MGPDHGLRLSLGIGVLLLVALVLGILALINDVFGPYGAPAVIGGMALAYLIGWGLESRL